MKENILRLFIPVSLSVCLFITSFAGPGTPPKKSSAAISQALVYPVAGKKAFIGSFWGAVRDGGKRKHQGIDIFAKKGTPIVAITDGVVTAVTNGGRGGKTVWLRSGSHGWTIYYAHLNEQKVRKGQIVKKGQLIGTVGNTGNARYTPAHLHFGIYTLRGAINPLPYVRHSPRLVSPVGNVLPKEPEAATETNTQTRVRTAPAGVSNIVI